MRIWRFWLNTLIWAVQYNPAALVELIMLVLAIGLLTIWEFIIPHWPYLVLGLSYSIGGSLSISVRKSLARSPQAHITQVMTALVILTSIYYFVYLAN